MKADLCLLLSINVVPSYFINLESKQNNYQFLINLSD